MFIQFPFFFPGALGLKVTEERKKRHINYAVEEKQSKSMQFSVIYFSTYVD